MNFILTWRRGRRDQQGGSLRMRPRHCTPLGLRPAISPNVGNSGAEFLVVGVRVRAAPDKTNKEKTRSEQRLYRSATKCQRRETLTRRSTRVLIMFSQLRSTQDQGVQRHFSFPVKTQFFFFQSLGWFRVRPKHKI